LNISEQGNKHNAVYQRFNYMTCDKSLVNKEINIPASTTDNCHLNNLLSMNDEMTILLILYDNDDGAYIVKKIFMIIIKMNN